MDTFTEALAQTILNAVLTGNRAVLERIPVEVAYTRPAPVLDGIAWHLWGWEGRN